MNPEEFRPQKRSRLRRWLGRHGLREENGETKLRSGQFVISDDDGRPLYEAQAFRATSSTHKVWGTMRPSHDGDFLLASGVKHSLPSPDMVGTVDLKGSLTVIHKYVEAKASVMPTGEPYMSHRGYVVEENIDSHGIHTFKATEKPLIEDLFHVAEERVPVAKGSLWIYGRPLDNAQDVPASAIDSQSLKVGHKISEIKRAIRALDHPGHTASDNLTW